MLVAGMPFCECFNVWLIAFALFLVNLFNVLVFIFSTVKKVINLQQVQHVKYINIVFLINVSLHRAVLQFFRLHEP